MASSFATTESNTLAEIKMIAGDWQEFVYNFYTSGGAEIDLTSASCTVNIFRYGDPSSVVVTLEGTAGSTINQFYATLPSASSINLNGVYQQQPRVEFLSGEIYNPHQGKIFVFPAPSN